MLKEQTIKCAFCQGTGKHPHFTGSCPVCKGRGKNQIRGKVVTCRDCRGFGQKRGTTLSCYDCGGTGVVPDTRETFRRAREEIKEAQEEITRGGEEFRKKPSALPTEEAEDEPGEDERGSCFCQSCAKKVNRESIIKVCFGCFRKIKKE